MKVLSLSLVGILLVVATSNAAIGSTNYNYNNRINNRLLQIAEAQLTDNNNADVSIVSQRAYGDEYTFHIVGEVQNTGTEAAEYVQIVASFYNENGQFVGTSYTFTAPTTVSPGMKAPFDIQLLTDDKIVKESSIYKLTLTWMNQNGKEMVKQYESAQIRQGQQSSSPTGSGNNILSQIPEATTTADISFGTKALQFLTYCNNQFSQTPVNNMAIDTLVFCTMVYDWYLMGCNNTILAPIIVAQCKDPVIIQLVNKYKTEIDIRIKQIVKIEVSPPPGNGGKPHDLTISITIAKDPIIRGNIQTITVTVSDTKSHEKIEGATINGKVQYVTGHIETFSCTTDSSGMCSHSWRISGDAKPGTFLVSVEVSAPGFKSASETSSFQVIAKKGNATLPIVNDTIVNDTSKVISNDTGIIGNETGFSDGEKGVGAGGDNGNTTLIPSTPPDPCIDNPSLPECTTSTPQALISDPCIENPTAEGCESTPPPPPPPPPDEGDTDDKSDTDTGDGEDSSDSSDSNSGGSGGSSGSSGANEDSKGGDTVPE